IDLGVSRLTLRAALDELVRDGHLDRRHGSGTYVTEPKIAQPLTLTSFSDDMRRRGMTPGSRTLELTTTFARARLAHRPAGTTEATVTSDEESEVLGVPLHTPAFLFERTTVSEAGRIVEFVRSIYRGDRYRLVAELVPQRSRNGRSAGASRGKAASESRGDQDN